ncbi:MAG: hypothetical protein K2Q26_03465, partial [Bdellovibrionales bacterium]|nr:hypothetical protein [Bdellovibrionales bacterium]
PVTLTNASTVYIENAPAAGTNTTITNPLALYAPAGNVSFGGSLGIGTTAPGERLTIGNGSFNFHDGGNKVIGFSSDFDVGGWDRQNGAPYQAGIEFNPTLGDLGIGIGGSDNADYMTSSNRLIIKASGNVGIGTNSPGQRLSVAGTIESTSGGIRFPDATTQATSAFGPVFYMNGGSVNTSAVATKIPLDTAFIDSNSSINTGLNRVVPTKAGYYSVTGKVSVSMTGTGAFTLSAMIYKNGASYEAYNQLINYTSPFVQTMTVTTLVYMNGTTDYLELYCGTNSGTATCTGSINGHYIRP